MDIYSVNRACAYMFEKCTSLQKVILRFTGYMSAGIGRSKYCFANMFAYCKNLNYIDVNFGNGKEWYEDDDNDDNHHFDQWLAGVSPTGIFVDGGGLDEEYGVSRIPSGWTYIDGTNSLTFVAQEKNVNIKLSGSISDSAALFYRKKSYSSTKWDAWKAYTINTVITGNTNDIIQFKNTSESFNIVEDNLIYVNPLQFYITGFVKSYGSINSLINYSSSLLLPYEFHKLFYNCSGLLTPPELNATELTPNCYSDMFARMYKFTICA